MKPLRKLIADARRAPANPDHIDSDPPLADRVLASLRHPNLEAAEPPASDWLVLGRWAAAVACALAIFAVSTAPQPEKSADAPAPNPLAGLGGW